MFTRLNEALQTAADVLAPPPTPLQDFEYHWKYVKNFYTANQTMPKVHVNNTNLPIHLEHMLKLLIDEENNSRRIHSEDLTAVQATPTGRTATAINAIKLIDTNPDNECFEFVITNRPLDLLADICITDSPPGATILILNWIRRFLSCLQQPHFEHKSIYEIILKLVASIKDTAGKASPYEREEIMFLLTVAGVVRKDPILLNLFLPMHLYTLTNTVIVPAIAPKDNTLFDGVMNANVVATLPVALATAAAADIDDEDVIGKALRSLKNGDGVDEKVEHKKLPCDCRHGDSLVLFDTIAQYFDSADSLVVVRACEAALILVSLPSMIADCCTLELTLSNFCNKLADRVGALCRAIPEDMDNGDIEDCTVSWGLLPRDAEIENFIGRPQLTEFLCWLDYANCVAKECSDTAIAIKLSEQLRFHLFESSIEPAIIEPNFTAFALVLASKVINKIDATFICDQLAIWLVGPPEDGACVSNDCLLNILIESAQENLDILLPTLQFVEALLDNANELILHSMLFRYLNNRGYYDAAAAANCIKSWSDEEDERERRQSNAIGPASSTTLRPSNILRIINNFLLLLPRQIMSGSIGTCYEEYVQDANRHYKNWLTKTATYNWPIDAVCFDKDDGLASPTMQPSASIIELKSCDSGIAEEIFYEGPLLRLLFTHVRYMAKHPYELNIAVIAILSKLSFLPHPYLHEILLNPELPLARGSNSLWSSMQSLAKHLLLEIPRIEGFHKRINETATRLLVNPPMLSEINDPLFESLIALEEFCKELAAIAFVKYHHATGC